MESVNFDRNSVVALLEAEELPVIDLPQTLENFRVVFENGELAGVAGLEIYGSFGLLRSVAVAQNFRGKGFAARLLLAIEQLAASKQITTIYLLTQTASIYFSRKGYQRITRDEVPAPIKASSEFSHVCPASAIVMKKQL